MILEFFLLLLVGIQLYVIWNLNAKVEAYEDQFDSYFSELRTAVLDINKQLHEIDHKGTFEADDEVGYFFTALKSLVEQLNIITGEADAPTEEAQEKK